MTARTALSLLAVLMLVAVGCGGDSDSGAAEISIETSSLSKSQFVERANKICVNGLKKVVAGLGSYTSKNASKKKGEEELNADAARAVIVPEIESQIDEIVALGAPGGDEEEVEAFLSAQQESLDSLKSAKRVSLTEELNKTFEEAGDLAVAYGISECNYGG